MYEIYKNKIVEDKSPFSIGWIIIENGLHISTWIIAGFLLYPIWTINGVPILTILWAGLVIFCQIALKKHICGGCYYYGKRCHLGWGKISSCLFEQDSGTVSAGKKLILFYMVPPPVIIISSLIFAFLTTAPWIYWGFLALYFLLNVASFPMRRKSCGECAMREVCVGSAVKSKSNEQ